MLDVDLHAVIAEAGIAEADSKRLSGGNLLHETFGYYGVKAADEGIGVDKEDSLPRFR